MGKLFLDQPSGEKLYACARCNTPLTNKQSLYSTRFTGSTGRAYLFTSATNLRYTPPFERTMLTGRHKVRDVHCLVCSEKLGWQYEYAHDADQRYKEAKVILEKILIKEIKGINEDKPYYKYPAETSQTTTSRRNSETGEDDDEEEEEEEEEGEHHDDDDEDEDGYPTEGDDDQDHDDENSDDGLIDNEADDDVGGEIFPDFVARR